LKRPLNIQFSILTGDKFPEAYTSQKFSPLGPIRSTVYCTAVHGCNGGNLTQW